MSWLCFYAGSYTWDLILQWNAKAGHMLDSYFSQLYPSIGLNHQTSTLHTISWNMFTFCCFLNLLFVNDMQIFILLARYMTDWNTSAIISFGLVVYHRRYFEKYFPFSVFMLHSYIKLLVSHLLSFWRAANVFSCAYILNLARPPHCQIPRQYQQALWYSGMSAVKYVLFWWVCHKLSRLNFHASNYWRLLIKGLEELWLLPSLFSLFMIFLVDMARQFSLLPHLLLF
jgi:hypothetical protein